MLSFLESDTSEKEESDTSEEVEEEPNPELDRVIAAGTPFKTIHFKTTSCNLESRSLDVYM